MLDSLARLWPEIDEAEAVEATTRFIYRALNGRDYHPEAADADAAPPAADANSAP